MAFENNTAILKTWAEKGEWNGHGAKEKMAAFAQLTKESDEPERIRILQRVFNGAISAFETVPLWD